MITLWRFPIPMEAEFQFDMPWGNRVEHVALLDRPPHEPSLWALVDSDRELVAHRFQIVGTGHPVAEDDPEAAKPWWLRWTHVGTWQQAGYVWHLYQSVEDSLRDPSQALS